MTRPLGPSATVLLDRVARQTAKRGRHVRRLSRSRMHRYRKSLDRLFDNAGSFTRTFPDGDAAIYRARCMELQDILGSANDAAVTGQLIALLTGRGGECRDAAMALDRWNEDRRRVALHGVKAANRRFRKTAPFWRAAS